MTTVAIIQARMGSTRLPGKVLMPLAGQPMVLHALRRVALVAGVERTVLATTDRPEDDPLAELVAARGWPVVRGSAEDVLARYHKAADAHGATTVLRFTADCPLLCPRVAGRVLADFRTGGADYVSNTVERTYPRGLDTEVFARTALDAAFREAVDQPHREHVTPFIWSQPQRFARRQVRGADDRSELRWTVDTPEDFALASRILDAVGADPAAAGYGQVLALVDAHPEWTALNAGISQKPV